MTAAATSRPVTTLRRRTRAAGIGVSSAFQATPTIDVAGTPTLPPTRGPVAGVRSLVVAAGGVTTGSDARTLGAQTTDRVRHTPSRIANRVTDFRCIVRLTVLIDTFCRAL